MKAVVERAKKGWYRINTQNSQLRNTKEAQPNLCDLPLGAQWASLAVAHFNSPNLASGTGLQNSDLAQALHPSGECQL